MGSVGRGSSDEALSPRQSLFVGVTLFSMFFGAGNLILPPLLGVQAGSATLPALLGFLVAGVGLPVLGIVAVALSGTLRDLCARVHPVFARVFVALVYLAIGPCLAIPRTASTAFEMLAPLLGEGVPLEVARLVFSVAFFAVAYALAMRPGRLTHLLGLHGLLKLKHVVAASGEVNALAEAAESEAYHEHQREYGPDGERTLVLAHEVEVGVLRHLL